MQFIAPGTVVFDSRPAVTVAGVAGTVIAIPVAAKTMTLGGSATATLGKID